MSDNNKNRILQDIIALKNKKPSSSHSVGIGENIMNKKGGGMSVVLGSHNITIGGNGHDESERGASLPPFLKKKPESASLTNSSENILVKDTEKSGKEENKEDKVFLDPTQQLTQEGEFGIRYDFNLGIRLYVPAGKWLVRMIDLDTRTLIYQAECGDVTIASKKRHFLRGRIEVERDGKLVWSHDYDAKNKHIMVAFPAGTVGDTLGWFPYAYRFAQQHGCHLHVVMSEHMKALMEPVYPDVTFYVKGDLAKNPEQMERFYATYYLGLFFQDKENIWQPSDFRMVGLHRTAGYILGVDPKEEPPRVNIEPGGRPIEEPYVVIAVQGSSACKLWHNPTGWLETVDYLKRIGYRVICIDLNPVIGNRVSWNAIPYGVEDETGSRPLNERARWIKHADFFVGLSSGLSWLAWAVGTPVVMISGFTHPTNEFENPYRVFSSHVCNSCWHDVAHPFQHNDYFFCPHHKGTARHYECTRSISSAYVIDVIKRLCADYNFLPLQERLLPKKVKKTRKQKKKITDEKG